MPSTFPGTIGDDTFSLTPNKTAAVLTLNGANTAISKLTTLTLQPLGGADHVEIGLIPATATKSIVVDLAGANGQPDGQVDTVTFDDGAGADAFLLTASGTGVKVSIFNAGSLAQTTVTGQDASDQLVFNLNAGSDTFDAHAISVPVIVNGGAGANSIIGSKGDDILNGGQDQDQISTSGGNDTVTAGAGEDKVFVNMLNPGHAIVDGGAEPVFQDTLAVTAGSTAGDTIVAGASGAHLLVSEGVAASVDAINIEHLILQPGGGADTLQVGDLTSAGVTRIEIDLSGASVTSGDGQVDTVNLPGAPVGGTVTVTPGADGQSETVVYSVGGVAVETVQITNLDAFDIVNIGTGAQAAMSGFSGDGFVI